MKGTLYGVGVGPGDPELMTLKAVKTIEGCDIIAVPDTGKTERVALEIAKQAVGGLERKKVVEVHMPMTRNRETLDRFHDRAAEELIAYLDEGNNVAFLTLGDPTIYSTSMSVHKRVLTTGRSAKIVPGIPSFCAVAARLNISLVEGGQPLHVIPASYEKTEEGLGLEGTKVLMKTGKAFGEVRELLKKKGAMKCAKMVQRCGMERERVFDSLEDADESASYFSVILVKEEETV